MPWFELWTSGIGSDRSTNWATTTAKTSLLCAGYYELHLSFGERGGGGMNQQHVSQTFFVRQHMTIPFVYFSAKKESKCNELICVGLLNKTLR